MEQEIKERDPDLIVVMGNFGLGYLTGQSGITTLAGRFLKGTHPVWKDKDVLACYHPAYVLRFDHLADDFIETFGLIKEYLNGDYVPLPGYGKYEVLDTLPKLKKYVKDEITGCEKLAFDTETGSLTPFQDEFPPLLCFSFSTKQQHGVTVPFDHPESPWRKDGPKKHERQAVIDILKGVFEDPDIPKLAQNEKFDRQHIRHALDQCDIQGLARDTMLTHLVIDERRGTHSLKRLAFIYTGMGGYDKPLDDYKKTHKEANPEKGGSYANIPASLLFPYAAMDADVTLRCDDGMLQEKEYTTNQKIQRLANEFLPRLSTILADLEYAGAMINVEKVKAMDVEYRTKMDAALAEIRAVPEVKQYELERTISKKGSEPHVFNPGSVPQLRALLFGKFGLRPTALTDTGFKRLVDRYTRVNAKNKEKDLPVVEFHTLVDKAIEREEWHLFTTNAESLHEYERQGNTLTPLILKYRELHTVHSTFIAPVLDRLDEWERVHGSYLPHGTATGRLSSVEPNLQNIPPEAKQMFISRFGDQGVILQADYSQVELRIAASWFGDPAMVRAYKKGIDLHSQTAADMHHMSLEQFMALPDKQRKPMRTRAKRINFGVLYGGGPPALVSTMKKDGVYITVEEAKEFISQYFAVRPGLKNGIKKIEKFVEKHGYLESFTGRRRRVPEVFSSDPEIKSRALRQSVNFPIQNGASEMTLMALILINEYLKENGFKSKLILTVHDSIVADCHVDEVVEVAQIMKQIMENLPVLSDEVLPGLDWSWLNVPIVAEFEVGYDWGHMVEFDPMEMAEEEGMVGEEPLFMQGDDLKVTLARNPITVDELWDAMAWKAGAA